VEIERYDALVQPRHRALPLRPPIQPPKGQVFRDPLSQVLSAEKPLRTEPSHGFKPGDPHGPIQRRAGEVADVGDTEVPPSPAEHSGGDTLDVGRDDHDDVSDFGKN